MATTIKKVSSAKPKPTTHTSSKTTSKTAPKVVVKPIAKTSSVTANKADQLFRSRVFMLSVVLFLVCFAYYIAAMRS